MHHILHISDLHFGRHSAFVAEHLLKFIAAQGEKIQLVIVTGDLTQRAKAGQFLAAQEFLARLPCPVVVIPGNHDVPLYNPFLRFLAPFGRFDRYIGSKFPSDHEDDEILVLGIRTVNVCSVADGKLSRGHADLLSARFPHQPKKLRILAAHHPVFGESRPWRDAILEAQPDIILSGHSHLSGVKSLNVGGNDFLVVSAGTTISSRTRSEVNSFNFLRYNPETKEGRVEVFIHGEGGFSGKGQETLFRKQSK